MDIFSELIISQWQFVNFCKFTSSHHQNAFFMTLPVVIGKSSADRPFLIDLIKLPHLFTSYSEEPQVQALFAQILEDLSANTSTIEIALGLSNRRTNSNFFKPHNLLIKHCFIPEDEGLSTEKSREGFMIALFGEIRKRKQLLRKGRSKRGGHGGTLVPMIVILHDVFPFVLSKKRSIGLIFLELLLDGPELNMHLLAISSYSYQNLVKQLLLLNPLVKERFHLAKSHNGLVKSEPLGAELVITGEGFFFFKERDAADYHRLYPPYEKRVVSKTVIQPMVRP